MLICYIPDIKHYMLAKKKIKKFNIIFTVLLTWKDIRLLQCYNMFMQQQVLGEGGGGGGGGEGCAGGGGSNAVNVRSVMLLI